MFDNIDIPTFDLDLTREYQRIGINTNINLNNAVYGFMYYMIDTYITKYSKQKKLINNFSKYFIECYKLLSNPEEKDAFYLTTEFKDEDEDEDNSKKVIKSIIEKYSNLSNRELKQKIIETLNEINLDKNKPEYKLLISGIFNVITAKGENRINMFSFINK